MQRISIHSVLEIGNIPRSFKFSLALSLICVVLTASLLILGQETSCFLSYGAGPFATLSSFISLTLSWVGFKPSHWKRDRNMQSQQASFQRFRFWVPLIFSMALLFQCLGMSLHAYYNVLYPFTFPTWADAAILAMYPFLLFGMLCFPTQSLPGRMRLSVFLNSSLVVIALITFSWYFLLGPMLLRHDGGNLLVVVAHLAFPVLDLLLISYIVLFVGIAPGGPLRLTSSIFSFALVVFALTDSLFLYRLLHGITDPGFIFLGWVIGNSTLALAIQSIRWLSPSAMTEWATAKASFKLTESIWQTLLPYAPVPVVFGLTLYLWGIDRTSPQAIGTYGLSLVLLVLIFVKQVVATREIIWLNRGLQTANNRLEGLATTDPLTELPNHRMLMTVLTSELERAQRYQRSCTLLFFDLDHFKALNDGYGHAAGDEVLFAFGQRLLRNVRSIDTVGRWGGEEFLAILSETTVDDAVEVAEKIRTAVSQEPFAIGGGLYLTCSIGLACYPTHATLLNDLVNAADQAMYAAKRLGRNQARRIDDPAVQLVLSAVNSGDGREDIALQGTIKALISMIERRNADLGSRSDMVADLVKQIASQMGIPEQEAHMMYLAGQLYDIGKIGIPDAILRKPDRLNAEEWQQIEKHAEIGAEIIMHIPALRPLAPVISAHHERWDGMGYPHQLSQENIPLAARIIAVVDAYTAMIVERPYQSACSPADALQELQRCAGAQFDPTIVETLVAVLGEQIRQEAVVLSVV